MQNKILRSLLLATLLLTPHVHAWLPENEDPKGKETPAQTNQVNDFQQSLNECRTRVDNLLSETQSVGNLPEVSSNHGSTAQPSRQIASQIESLHLARTSLQTLTAQDVAPDRFRSLLHEQARKIPFIQSILNYLERKRIPLLIGGESCREQGAAGLYYAPPKNEIHLCVTEGTNLGQVLSTFVHEATHAAQAHADELPLKDVYNMLPRRGEGASALFSKYDLSPEMHHKSLQIRSEDDRLRKQLSATNAEKIADWETKLGEMEKLFVVDTSENGLEFHPKHPKTITQAEHWRQVEKRLMTFDQYRAQGQNLPQDEPSVLLNTGFLHFNRWLEAHPSTARPTRRLQLEAYQEFLKIEYRTMLQSLQNTPAQKETFLKLLDLDFNKEGRLLSFVQTYCNEIQGNLVGQAVNFAAAWPIRDIPQCRNFMASMGRRGQSFEQNPFHPNFAHRGSSTESLRAIEHTVHNELCSCRSALYGSRFSPLYGMDRFRDIFQPSSCQRRPADFLPGGSLWGSFW